MDVSKDSRISHRKRPLGLGPAVFAGLLATFAVFSPGCTPSPGRADARGGDARIEQGEIRPGIVLTGELAAESAARFVVPNVNIWPMTIRWLAEEGSEVKAGDPVVEFDSSQLTGNLEMLRSQVVEAANRLSQTRAKASSDRSTAFFDLERRKGDLEKARLGAALPREITSEQEWARLQLELEKAELESDKAERALAAVEEASQASIDVDRLALEKAELALSRAERGLEVMRLTSPRDGIVLIADNRREGRSFRVGDATWPGLTVASLPDLSTLRIEAGLFDVDEGRVVPGARAEIALDAFPDDVLVGEVTSISGFARSFSFRSARRRFEVSIDVDGLDPERMRPGMSARIEVSGAPVKGTIVPRDALSWTDDLEGVRVVLADGSTREGEVVACDAHRCIVRGLDVDEAAALADSSEVGG